MISATTTTRVACWAEKKGKKAYTYFFSRVQTVRIAPGRDDVGPSPAGATHTAEISFAWNNPKGQPAQTWNEIDLKLADQMSSYWVNFAKTGDPNAPGLPRWGAYKPNGGGQVMELGKEISLRAELHRDRYEFFDALYRKLSSQ